MKRLYLFIVLALVLSGCKTVKPIAEQKDSVRVEYKLDSIYLYERDSIFIDRYRSNDTVWLTTTNWKVRYKDVIKEVHDTISLSTTETVEVPYVPAYYKRVSTGFWILLAVLVLIVGWKVAKIYFKIQSGGLL